MRERVPDTRSKAVPKQSRQGKHLVGEPTSIGVMFLNMQITFVMAKRIDHIQRLTIIGTDHLLPAKGHPDISSMGVHGHPPPGSKVFGVVFGPSGFYSDHHAHSI